MNTKPRSASMQLEHNGLENTRKSSSAGKTRFPDIHQRPNAELSKSMQPRIEKNNTLSMTSPAKPLHSTLNGERGKPPLLFAKPMVPLAKTDLQDTSTTDAQLEIPFEKVVKLMTDRHSSDQVDRHEVELRKLLKSRKEGFYMDETEQLLFVINKCFEQILEQKRDSYIEVLSLLLEVCSRPLKIRKSTDNLMRGDSLKNILEAAGKILKLPYSKADHTKTLAAQCINTIVTRQCDEDIIQTVIADSPVVSDIVSELNNLVGKVSPNHETLVAVVEATKAISTFPASAAALTHAGGLSKFIQILEFTDFKESIFFDVVYSLWNVLQLYEVAREVLGESHSVSVIYNCVKALVTSGYRDRDKELRNDLLVISSYIAQQEQNQKLFLGTGYLDLLCLVSVDVELQPDSARSFTQTTSEQDFELKKLIWNVLYVLTFSDDCLVNMIQHGFVDVLLNYVDEQIQSPSPMFLKWSLNQRTELQLLALKILFVISIRVPEEFSKCHGSQTCLNFAKTVRDEMLFSAALSVLVNSSTTDIGTRDLSSEDTMQVMLEMAVDMTFPINCRRDALQVVSSMCGNDEKQQIRFGECGGVEKLISLLQGDAYITGFDDFLFIIVDSLWCCIVGDEYNEKTFIVNDGIHFIMSTLEQGSNWVKLQIMSCLIDLMSGNKTAIEEIRAWQSTKTKRPSSKLLVDMWRQTEREDPTVEGDEKDNTGPKNKTRKIDIVELAGMMVPKDDIDLKVKIYHMFALIGFNIAEEQLVNHNDLHLLAVISEYDKILVDRVWKDIDESLQKEEVRPTSADADRLQRKSNKAQDRERMIKDRQAEIDVMHKVTSENQEENFYQTLRDLRKEKKVFSGGMSIFAIKLQKAKFKKSSNYRTTTTNTHRVKNVDSTLSQQIESNIRASHNISDDPSSRTTSSASNESMPSYE